MYKQKTLFGLALAVIVLGVALAMWSETLYVHVTVNTGYVDVSISAQCVEAQEAEGKDVGSCEVEVVDNSVTVTIDNAYPGYTVDVYLTVKNDGSIPVKLLSSSISGVDESALSVTLTKPANTQIDPGCTSTYTLHIEVLEDAEQDSSYSFTVTLEFANWNEVTG